MLSLKDQCTLLGYNLHYWDIDLWGQKRRYHAAPMVPGSHNYFDTREEVQRWIDEVNFIRECYSEGTTLLTLWQQKRGYTPK